MAKEHPTWKEIDGALNMASIVHDLREDNAKCVELVEKAPQKDQRIGKALQQEIHAPSPFKDLDDAGNMKIRSVEKSTGGKEVNVGEREFWCVVKGNGLSSVKMVLLRSQDHGEKVAQSLLVVHDAAFEKETMPRGGDVLKFRVLVDKDAEGHPPVPGWYALTLLDDHQHHVREPNAIRLVSGTPTPQQSGEPPGGTPAGQPPGGTPAGPSPGATTPPGPSFNYTEISTALAELVNNPFLGEVDANLRALQEDFSLLRAVIDEKDAVGNAFPQHFAKMRAAQDLFDNLPSSEQKKIGSYASLHTAFKGLFNKYYERPDSLREFPKNARKSFTTNTQAAADISIPGHSRTLLDEIKANNQAKVQTILGLSENGTTLEIRKDLGFYRGRFRSLHTYYFGDFKNAVEVFLADIQAKMAASGTAAPTP
jgi:hypothetical protein